MNSMKYSDEQLLEIIQEIDGLSTSVSDRDANFIESILSRYEQYGLLKFSHAQANWIMDMEQRYIRR